MRGVLRKDGKKVCRATSEVAMGRRQGGSRKTLSKEVVQEKKGHPSETLDSPPFSSPLLLHALVTTSGLTDI